MTPDQRLLANVAGFLAGVVLLIAGGAWAGYAWRDATATAEIETLKREHATQREQLASAQTAAVQKARSEEQRTQHRIQEVLDAEHLRRLAKEASERRARAAADGLRAQADVTQRAFAALAAHDSAATEECRAAAQTAVVCTGLLHQCGERRLEVARFAEDSHAAATTCAGAYRALTLDRPMRLGEAR